jgi:DNA-binding Lrp family transcriptional regulator
MPPFGNLYGMDVLVADSLAEDEEIAFNACSQRARPHAVQGVRAARPTEGLEVHREGLVMKAYVFVTTTTVNPAQVAQQIRQIPGIKAADLCWGQPDIMAVAESADAKALQELVVDRVQKVSGVRQTDSHIVCGT